MNNTTRLSRSVLGMNEAKMKSKSYGVGATSYLERARARLIDDQETSIFYAALELRCCVEARQAEYIEHLSVYKNQKLRPYRIGENRTKIAKISGGELIAKMTFNFEDGVTLEGFHTPVPAALTKYCETSLDALRHAQTTFRALDDPWWRDAREGLEKHYRLAWVACRGNLLVPPLWNGIGKPAHPLVIEATDGDTSLIERMQGSVGKPFKVQVEYLEAPPPDWICDL